MFRKRKTQFRLYQVLIGMFIDIPMHMFNCWLLMSGRCSRPSTPFLSCPVSCFDGQEDTPHDLQGLSDKGLVCPNRTKHIWLSHVHEVEFVSLLFYSLEEHDEWWLYCADAPWISLLPERQSKWKNYTGPYKETSGDCRDGLSVETQSFITWIT